MTGSVTRKQRAEGERAMAAERAKTARVRKARRTGTVGCGHIVLTGQTIVYHDGRWLCLPCDTVRLSNPR